MRLENPFISKTFSTFITNEFLSVCFRLCLAFICKQCIDIGIKYLAIFVHFWHLLRRAKDWIRRNAAFPFPFATNIDACTLNTVCLWSGGIPKKNLSNIWKLFLCLINIGDRKTMQKIEFPRWLFELIQPIYQHIFALPLSALKKPLWQLNFLQLPHQVNRHENQKWCEMLERFLGGYFSPL